MDGVTPSRDGTEATWAPGDKKNSIQQRKEGGSFSLECSRRTERQPWRLEWQVGAIIPVSVYRPLFYACHSKGVVAVVHWEPKSQEQDGWDEAGACEELQKQPWAMTL